MGDYASGVSHFTLPPAAEIGPTLKTYHDALLGPRDVLETGNTQGIKLYEMLLAPAEKLIPHGSRVIILPDGALYGLNFETLLAPAPQLHYWIEDAVVENANSLVLLAASTNAPAAKSRKLLLIGDPISPSRDFPDLPQAGGEMNDVERYFGPHIGLFSRGSGRRRLDICRVIRHTIHTYTSSRMGLRAALAHLILP